MIPSIDQYNCHSLPFFFSFFPIFYLGLTVFFLLINKNNNYNDFTKKKLIIRHYDQTFPPAFGFKAPGAWLNRESSTSLWTLFYTVLAFQLELVIAANFEIDLREGRSGKVWAHFRDLSVSTVTLPAYTPCEIAYPWEIKKLAKDM